MTVSAVTASIKDVPKSRVALFNDLGIYRFCLLMAAVDLFDLYDFLESSNFVKYAYAAIVLGFMATYYLRWRKVDATIAPVIFLLFFFLTGLVFAFRFFVFEERNSYISAFIAPLVFAASIFIPRDTVALDTRKITRDLMILFAAGSAFYVIEGLIKPVASVSGGQDQIQLVKSMSCLLALCLSILLGKKSLALIFAVVSVVSLELRPASTFAMGLLCCLPIAIVLRWRVRYPSANAVIIARALTMMAFVFIVSVPLLLYFFFDDISSIISSSEEALKEDYLGGRSNMAFRLEILRLAFDSLRKTSFWYGNALSGSVTVPLGHAQTWHWWYSQNSEGVATIHSDFVIVLTLMGIVGYIIFSGAFYSVLSARLREFRYRNLPDGEVVLRAIAIVGCIALMVYCSDQPYLSYYSHAHLVWMLLLISEVAIKSKANWLRSKGPAITLEAGKTPK